MATQQTIAEALLIRMDDLAIYEVPNSERMIRSDYVEISEVAYIERMATQQLPKLY